MGDSIALSNFLTPVSPDKLTSWQRGTQFSLLHVEEQLKQQGLYDFSPPAMVDEQNESKSRGL